MKSSISLRITRLATLVGVLSAVAAFAPTVSHAQNAVSAEMSAATLRARQLSDAGDDGKSRQLLDSLVNNASRESFDAAEALYWRAILSESSTSAELDWKRIILDVPFSPRASEALLRVAEIDLQRANRSLARQHVNQLLTDYPNSPQRPRALLIMTRSYFDERDAPRGCGALTAVRREAKLGDVETRLQADELQQQCRDVKEVALGAAPEPSRPTTGTTPTLAAQTAALPPASAGRGGRGTAVNTDSIRRDSVARATAARNAARAAADSVRRDSVARATAQRTAAREAAREAADSVRRDSVARVASQRMADSVRRDSITKAGLIRAASQRARQDSIDREMRRLDSIALDSMGRGRTASSATTGSTATPRTAPAAGTTGVTATPARGGTREVLVFRADSARGDSLAREAAAIEARIMGRADSAKRAAEERAAARAEAAAKNGKWTVQIAAYQTKADADALVKRLAARDISARVAGTKKPYRVQVGRYATRAEATEAVATLKKNGQKSAFVAEIGK
ncbi:MAG: SPOR domain-containing protein [Gemmatimonas sp.]